MRPACFLPTLSGPSGTALGESLSPFMNSLSSSVLSLLVSHRSNSTSALAAADALLGLPASASLPAPTWRAALAAGLVRFRLSPCRAPMRPFLFTPFSTLSRSLGSTPASSSLPSSLRSEESEVLTWSLSWSTCASWEPSSSAILSTRRWSSCTRALFLPPLFFFSASSSSLSLRSFSRSCSYFFSASAFSLSRLSSAWRVFLSFSELFVTFFSISMLRCRSFSRSVVAACSSDSVAPFSTSTSEAHFWQRLISRLLLARSLVQTLSSSFLSLSSARPFLASAFSLARVASVFLNSSICAWSFLPSFSRTPPPPFLPMFP
mmetsp:Transcript_5850/g.14996  ORF Transcript_5850/g.14996 Transcript_5850/m.14996 type:complete len:320 (-) Transcript_5850:97-1056(-)